MPNTFIAFLEKYTDLTENENAQEPEQKSSNTRKTRTQIVTDSRQVIEESKVQGFSKIGRVFNDFPLEFTSQSSQHFQAIEPHFIADWSKRFFEFLTSTTLDWTTEEISLSTKTGNVIKDLPRCDVANKKSEEKLYSLLNEIISKASDDLLNENGQLHDSIIQLFNLHNIIKLYEGQTKQLENIKLQVISSYCAQIVLGNIIEPLKEIASKELKDHPEAAEQFELNLGPFTKLIQDQIITNSVPQKDSEGHDYIDHPFSQYFKNSIEQSVLNRFYKTPIHEQCAAELIKFHPDKIKEIIAADLEKSKLFQEQLLASQALTTKITSTLPIHKIHFWIDVFDFCCKQKEEYYSLMFAIKNYLDEQITSENVLQDSGYFEKYMRCLRETKNKSHIYAEEKEQFQNQHAEGQLTKLLNAHTNLYLIDSIPTNKKTYKILRKYKSKSDFIQKSPVSVMSALHEGLQSSNTLEPILRAYRNALEHTHFFEQANINLEILHQLFSNPFDYSDIENLSSSNIEIYNKKLAEIVNSLITSTQTKLLKLHESYYLAHDTIRPLYLHFRLYLKQLNNSLTQLEDAASPKKWLPLLQELHVELTNLTPLLQFAETLSHLPYATVMPDSSTETLAKLSEHKISKERIIFSNRINSDFNMLRKLVDPISNLTRGFASKLETLQTFDFSIDDISTLSKKYTSEVTTIINELLDTIYNKLIKDNLSYIVANETISGVYDDYNLLVQFIKTELNRLNHTTEIWPRALDYFCKQFILYALQLKEFAGAIETLKTPTEVGLTAKDYTEKKSEHSAIETSAQILSIVADNQLFKMATQAAHKSRGDGKNYNPLPNRSNRATMEIDKLSDGKIVKTIFQNIDDYLKNGRLDKAIPLINSLPPKIISNIYDYCTVSYEIMQEAISLASSTRMSAQEYLTIHPAEENDQEAKLDSTVSQKTMFKIHKTVLNIFEFNANQITNSKHQNNLRTAIQTLSQCATNSTEYIVMLAAEKEALPSGKRSNILSICLEKAKILCEIYPSINAGSYLTAKKLLEYVNECQSKTFQFSSRDFEIDIARSIARLMIQLSLIIDNPSVKNETPKSKQREILEALEAACFKEKIDPQLLKILSPILAEIQPIFQEKCLPDTRYQHQGP